MKRPFDEYRELFRKTNEKDKELLKYVFEKQDSISLWIVGLATGGFAIFATNIFDAKKAIPAQFLRPLLILFIVVIMSCIIHRICYLLLYQLSDQNFRAIDIAFSNEQTMATESRLAGNETFSQLIGRLKIDFDEDHSAALPVFDAAHDSGKIHLYNSLKSHYFDMVRFADKDVELAKEFATDTYIKFFGYKKRTIQNIFQKEKIGKQYQLVQWLTLIFYVIFLLSFFAIMILFVAAV